MKSPIIDSENLQAWRATVMEGKLELNLDPAFIGFTSPNTKRYFHYCKPDDVIQLLLDLKLIAPERETQIKECYVSISADFPGDVLAKHGLCRYMHDKKEHSHAS